MVEEREREKRREREQVGKEGKEKERIERGRSIIGQKRGLEKLEGCRRRRIQEGGEREGERGRERER